MRAFQHPSAAIKYTKECLINHGYVVKTERWQGIPSPDDMFELLGHSLRFVIPETEDVLIEEVRPNLPWAKEHFEERVSGEPLNPPPSHIRWPFAQKSNEQFGGNEKFSHTYPERIWPKFASDSSNEITEGIRYDYGDFNDVVDLMVREPFTRQAFLPIWFPEDTGSVHGERVPCFTGEIEIQTSTGYRKIKDASVGDQVITHNGRFRNIEKVYQSRYTDQIISIKTSNTNQEIRTTRDHPFLVVKNKGFLPSDSRFEWIEEWINAEDINPGDYVVHSFINDNTESKYSDDLMRLFGYYLAEGDIIFDKRYGNKKPCTVRFNMSTKDERNGYIDDIANIIRNEFNREVKIKRPIRINDEQSIRIYFHSVDFAKTLYDMFGSGSYNKIIPIEFLKLPSKSQLQTLIGFTRGDGSFEPNQKNIECTSVSPSIIMGLRTMCFRNGIYNSLQKIKLRKPYFNKMLNRVIKPNYPTYKLVFSQGGRLSSEFFNIEIVENQREIYRHKWFNSNRVLFSVNTKDEISNPDGIDVYNLQVEGDNSYNISNCTVHNCTIGYHFIRRGDHMHIVYYIRSCDYIRHFRDDIYLACMKLYWLLDKLKEKDYETWKDVKPGWYTMHITSLHCFNKEKGILKQSRL